MADAEIKGQGEAKKELKKEVGKGKESGFWGKYKWWIITGAIIVVVLIVWYVHKQGTSASTAATAQNNQSNIDPATGYPYGSPADLAALGSAGSIVPTSVGGTTDGSGLATGPAGPAGATGAAGTGGITDLWDLATSILQGRGISSPTHAQIGAVWHNLRLAAGSWTN